MGDNKTEVVSNLAKYLTCITLLYDFKQSDALYDEYSEGLNMLSFQELQSLCLSMGFALDPLSLPCPLNPQLSWACFLHVERALGFSFGS